MDQIWLEERYGRGGESCERVVVRGGAGVVGLFWRALVW